MEHLAKWSLLAQFLSLGLWSEHYDNLPMQYPEILFSAVKTENFVGKILIFLMFAQNFDCGYTLEPPR